MNAPSVTWIAVHVFAFWATLAVSATTVGQARRTDSESSSALETALDEAAQSLESQSINNQIEGPNKWNVEQKVGRNGGDGILGQMLDYVDRHSDHHTSAVSKAVKMKEKNKNDQDSSNFATLHNTQSSLKSIAQNDKYLKVKKIAAAVKAKLLRIAKKKLKKIKTKKNKKMKKKMVKKKKHRKPLTIVDLIDAQRVLGHYHGSLQALYNIYYRVYTSLKAKYLRLRFKCNKIRRKQRKKSRWSGILKKRFRRNRFKPSSHRRFRLRRSRG
uniref:Uncharacterized protein 27 n=1 Tax=Halisarca dujardinii TaxID=2583056 RepID=A0AA96S103_HALDU|nr:uncharacterized protein 27 [Halisarca dujardinii]